jgi:CubicO group peptidase (beta-lactamase class C family)
LAAYIIELAAKTPFDEYTSKYIFQPLKMNDTHWFYNDLKADKYATLYEVNKQSIPLYNQILNADGSLKIYSCNSYPDGSLKTSATDMTKYMIEMMKGYFSNSNLLSKQSFATLFAKQFNESNMPANMDEKEPNRAIFWAYNRKGKLVHTGGDPGVSAFISFDPATKIGRILLINTGLEGDDDIAIKTYFQKLISSINDFEAELK